MYLGIDVGGTNLVAGLVDREGSLTHKAACPVDRSWSQEELVFQLARLSVRAAEEGGCPLEKLEGAGVGLPGLVDNDAGVVVTTPNMPFRDAPFRELYQRELDIRCIWAMTPTAPPPGSTGPERPKGATRW